MIPLALNPSRLQLGLVGAGAPGVRRLRALRAAGAMTLAVYTQDPELAAEAGVVPCPALPGAEEIGQLHALWIAGLTREQYVPLAEAARTQRVLLNVEDVPGYCDFHAVAELRRGDLLIGISTGGTAPGLAGALRRRMETCFPTDWTARVAEITAQRQAWRAEGMTMAEIAQRIEAWMDMQCWPACPKSGQTS